MKGKQFIKKLRQAGVEIVEGRGKGGHVLARYRGKQTTVPTHGDSDMSHFFLKKICRQLGILFEEII